MYKGILFIYLQHNSRESFLVELTCVLVQHSDLYTKCHIHTLQHKIPNITLVFPKGVGRTREYFLRLGTLSVQVR